MKMASAILMAIRCFWFGGLCHHARPSRVETDTYPPPDAIR